MASILEQLEIKPVPKFKKGINIAIPIKGQVLIKTRVIDRTGEQFDRKAVLRRLQTRGLSIPKIDRQCKIKILTEALIEPVPSQGVRDDTWYQEDENRGAGERKDDANAPMQIEQSDQIKQQDIIAAPPKLRIKKIKGKIKLNKKFSKQIKKGTITAISSTVEPKRLAIKMPKVSIKALSRRSQQQQQAPSEIIRFEQELDNHLPKAEASINIRSAAYYRNNREIFINFINSLFAPYKDALQDESKNITCESLNEQKSGRFSLLTHQEIVRDYINLYTPYRGLLLYHGLGAGKTCASIAIAEGFQSHTNIMILTPASLRMNYIGELKVCGNTLYRVNQYWEFVSNNNNAQKTHVLAKMLSIPEKYVKKYGGAWFVNVKNEPNYITLTAPEKISLNDQINEMIRAKYQFINYNGLLKSHLNGLTNNGKINPFSNKVIIIDEAHNFISRIVNKRNKPDSLSMKLYEYLLSAEQCRIVLLTGTPIINYPNELGILFNILRGYIRTFNFNLSIRTKGKVDQNIIEKIIGDVIVHDYVEYKPSSKMLVITRNPFGFINSRSKTGLYEGIRLNRQGNMPTAKFIAIITSRLENANIGVLKASEGAPFKALPDTLDEFQAMFIDPKTNNLKNINLLKRRVLGLTSYFRSAQEELMPTFDKEKDVIVEQIPMSNYQFGVYEMARAEERKMASRRAKKSKSGGSSEEEDSSSTYRIFSRAFCNFVFPPEIPRPKPKEGEEIGAVLKRNVDEDILDTITIQEQVANIDGRHEQDDAREMERARADNIDNSYEQRILNAVHSLKENAAEYLSPRGLETLSPKFLQIYNNITSDEQRGLHLVYSQFRTLEGIGIFSMILEQNGFAKFNIAKDDRNVWQILERPGDEDKPKFALYTGTETAEVKDLTRLIFNGEWDKLPDSLRDALNERAPNNNYGGIIKVFMITSSGAEGITLKNVRFVHITEPYWHPVRMEQVIGRARRICSHDSLDVEDRTVKVFLYLMYFTADQLLPAVVSGGMASKGLLEKDVSKIDKTTPLTSDQALFEISNIKEDINKQLLRAIKESAFDCALHAKEGDKEALICMSFGNPSPTRYTTTPALTIEKNYDEEQQRNMKKITWKARVLTISGKKYAFKMDGAKSKTGEVYDLESYKRAINPRRGGQPILVGKLIKDDKTGKLSFQRI